MLATHEAPGAGSIKKVDTVQRYTFIILKPSSIFCPSFCSIDAIYKGLDYLAQPQSWFVDQSYLHSKYHDMRYAETSVSFK